MKCQGQGETGAPCEYEFEEGVKFCPECGAQRPQKATEAEVTYLCPGKDGSCKTELTAKLKFCPQCGTKVKPEWLEKSLIQCEGTNDDGTKCSSILSPGTKFCGQCGTPVKTAAPKAKRQEEKKTAVEETETEKKPKNEPASAAEEAPRVPETVPSGQTVSPVSPAESEVDPSPRPPKPSSSGEEVKPSSSPSGQDLKVTDDPDKPQKHGFGSSRGDVDPFLAPPSTTTSSLGEEDESNQFPESAQEERQTESPPPPVPGEGNRESENRTVQPSANASSFDRSGRQVLEGASGVLYSTSLGSQRTEERMPARTDGSVGATPAAAQGSLSKTTANRRPATVSSRLPETPQEQEREQGGVAPSGGKDEIDVVFHILFSEDFPVSKKRVPCLTLNEREVVGKIWEPMTILGKVGPLTEAQAKLRIPRKMGARGFQYKYGVMEKKSLEEEKATERKFRLPQDKHMLNDAYYQYDGVAYPNTWKESAKRAVKWGNRKRDTKLAAERYLQPQVTRSLQSHRPVASIFDEIRRTVESLKAGTSMQEDENLAKECIREYLLNPLLQKLAAFSNTTEASEMKVPAIVVAILYVLIMDEYGLDLIDSHSETVFKAFTLHPRPDQECPEFDAVRQHFPDDLNNLHIPILRVIRKHLNSSSPDVDVRWLHCVPLLHFLLKESEPYKTPRPYRHDTKEFWGVKTLNDDVEKMKRKPWKQSPREILDEIGSSCKVDLLMSRTFMATLTLKQVSQVLRTGMFEPEACVGVLVYYCKICRQDLYNRYRDPGTFYEEANTAMEALDQVVQQWLEEKVHGEESATGQRDITGLRNTLSELLREVVSTVHKPLVTTIVLKTFSCLLRCLNGEMSKQAARQERNATADEIQQILFTWVNEITKWLQNYHPFAKSTRFAAVLEVWNSFAALEGLTPDLPPWALTIADVFRQIVKKTDFKRRFEELLVSTSQLSEVMRRAVHEISKTALQEALESGEKVTANKEVGIVLSSMLEENWPDDGSFIALLQFILNCLPVRLCLSLMKSKDLNEILTEEGHKKFEQLRRVIEEVTNGLETGDITAASIQFLRDNEDSFRSVMKAAQREDQTPVGDLVKLLKGRNEELTAYHDHARKMGAFLHLLRLPQGSSIDIWDREKELRDSHCSLRILCSPRDKDTILREHTGPVVNPFDLPHEILEILPTCSIRQESGIFRHLWEEEMSRSQTSDSDAYAAFIAAWNHVEQEWNHLCSEVNAGTITFSRMRCLIAMYQNDTDKIRHEFTLMAENPEEPWIGERLQQLSSYQTIIKCRKAAEIIRSLKAILGVPDFDEIDKILKLVSNRDEPMAQLNTSVLAACQALQDVTQDQVKCLDELEKSKNLLNWLKETMSGGLRELKVFVDLASQSAGEGAMEVDRVHCFHSAVTSYAPLIFDVGRDTSWEDFLKKCRLVWREFATNPNLPHKLRDANRHLEWLKMVKQIHSSVEVTSLSQVSIINERGVYRVGNITKAPSSQFQDLNEALDLRVRPDEQIPNGKTYSYKDLVDLQSRVMLVAGQDEKGKDSVEKFTMVLDAMLRLAKVYMALCSDGCILFNYWRADFLCDETRPNCLHVEFGEGDDCIPLEASREGHTLETFVRAVASCLESYREKWVNFLNEKRKDYTELNYFTVQQLVYLQKELIKVKETSESNALLHSMLSLVLPDCSRENLLEAMRQAQEEVDERKSITVEENKDEENPESEDEFLQKMMEAGFSEALAKRAQREGIQLIDAGVAWCMAHDDDTYKETDEEADSEASRSFQGWQSTGESISAATSRWVSENKEAKGVQKLKKSMDDIWTKFLEAVQSSASDYLSLEHLAIILRMLSRMNSSILKRSLLRPLKENTPNLIVCPRAGVLKTAICVYMHKPDEPLPKPDELLLCGGNTTFDEVDVFLRRAFFGGNGRIHVLIDADHLKFDVEDQTVQCLTQYAATTDKPYQLVVLCSDEKRYTSQIVAALQKHCCEPPTVPNSAVRDYLKTKMCGTAEKGGISSASHVDFDRSTVRVVKSKRAGVGKTLYKNRLVEKLKECHGEKAKEFKLSVSVPLFERRVDTSAVADRLLRHIHMPEDAMARIFHFDISGRVEDGVEAFLFNLTILGCLKNSFGHVWLRSPMDLYIIENTTAQSQLKSESEEKRGQTMLDLLPEMHCWSPLESLHVLQNTKKPEGYSENDRIFDIQEYQSDVYQRPYQYLKRVKEGKSLNDVDASEVEGTPEDCLKALLEQCSLQNPSWSELSHFVRFLNTQLADFEKSAFVQSSNEDALPGFAKFLLRFLFTMSQDFATRSLNLSEESTNSAEEETTAEDDAELLQFQIRRTWESSPHPYIFFNHDRVTMTFLGFNIDPKNGNLLDQQTRAVLEERIMTKELLQAMKLNRVPLDETVDSLTRGVLEEKLAKVVGQEKPGETDKTYELTADNVKKMMAIYLRFRCGIPVIVMGETGCGKTRLVKFLCELQCPADETVQNMVLMKVHGGTTTSDIINKVRDAERLANENAERFGSQMYTVLFFDEANTTEAIGLIKEIMCDGTLNGEPLDLSKNLKMVAACNPYRKHSDEMVKRLETAGLGYHVGADETADCLGRIPMRRLVYRVQPLPQSMLPLVWDFGQLTTSVEEMYICQMVKRYVKEGRLPSKPGIVEKLSRILITAQSHMRTKNDECSFVSLRDVERTLQLMSWFCDKVHQDGWFSQQRDDPLEDEDGDVIRLGDEVADNLTKALILALAVCYRACLCSRRDFDRVIMKAISAPFSCLRDKDSFSTIIEIAQKCFMDSVQLEPNIAKNHALSENLFMMVVCTELRIPLFLVGKPGSSKSLAKTIVCDAMQGTSAHHPLFRGMKQVQMTSYQCSPLSTAEGIVSTFRQCARFQRDKNLDKFVSVVVLDEVGLAEDSPQMPLKTLHPLLEDGCVGDEKPEDYKKVAFIGISNWALDPAKMNRGILVQRDVPDEQELITSAEGICSNDTSTKQLVSPMIPMLASGYLRVFKESQEKREFFGLRDFYSLVKMICGFAKRCQRKICYTQLHHAIKRNFGGLEDVDVVKLFMEEVRGVPAETEPCSGDPDCSPLWMIEAGLFGDQLQSENRYLLLLTENYSALNILKQKIFAGRRPPHIIFGSSFPRDQEYTQICRNINKVKVCMEMGKIVILLNLENLYESLYDAFNQYYSRLGGEKYVDLGLGTHRVKCRVHENFKVMVIANKQVVYDTFPTPLINRLEKHFLTLGSLMSERQRELAHKLRQWINNFVTTQQKKEICNHGDAFVGFHQDVPNLLVLQMWNDTGSEINRKMQEEVMQKCQDALLWCATPDAVLRVEKSRLHSDKDTIAGTYFVQQQHDSLVQFLRYKIETAKDDHCLVQVTTHSRLLKDVDRLHFAEKLQIEQDNTAVLTLQSFDTELQFTQQLRKFIEKDTTSSRLLMVQCVAGDRNMDLIKCAQHCVVDTLLQDSKNLFVVFIVQLPRISAKKFSGFQSVDWQSIHIDDLLEPDVPVSFSWAIAYFSPCKILQDLYTPTKKSSNEEAPEEETERKDFCNLECFQNLIQGCLPAALACIADSGRSTRRFDLLLNLISAENASYSASFLEGISARIVGLMKEKEVVSPGSSLASDASKMETVHLAGSFRKAWMQCLQTKVIPILAQIIGFIDTNNNLDALVSEEDTDWKSALWLAILKSEEACQIHYQALGGETVRTESISAGHGERFSLKMPFSWILLPQLEELVADMMKRGGRIEEIDTVVEGMPFCQILLEATRGSEKEAVAAFMQDAIRSKLRVPSEDVCEILCEALRTACGQMEVDLSNHPVPNAMLRVCWVLREAESRLRSFLLVQQNWPDVTSKLLPPGDTGIWTKNELTIDALSLNMVLQHLEPPKDSLNKAEGRRQWINLVNKWSPIISHLFTPKPSEMLQIGESCSEMLKNARPLWTRVLTVKLFIDNFYPPDCKSELQLRCMALWISLGTKVDLRTRESLEKVEQFLKLTNHNIIKKLLQGEAVCPHCKAEFEAPPVELPCQHPCCLKCFHDAQALPNPECPRPGCHKPFPKDWDPNTVGPAQSEQQKEFRMYQQRCNSFLMSLVSRLCFAGEEAPEPALIEKIVSYVIRKPEGGETLQTKQFTLFDNLVDPTPIVRSFLLRLLLQQSGDDTRRHLQEFFQQASKSCESEKTSETDRSDEGVRGVAILLLYCVEDGHFESSPSSMRSVVEELIRYLTDVKKDVFDSTFGIQKVQGIARCRYVLTSVAKLLHSVEVEGRCKVPQEMRALYEALLTTLQELLRDPDMEIFRVFLIKEICLGFGLDAFHALTSDPQGAFSYLRVEEENVPVCQDCFLAHGELYTTTRDTVDDVLQGENPSRLSTALEDCDEAEAEAEQHILLALHRTVTMSYLTPSTQQEKNWKKFFTALRKYIMTCPAVKQKNLACALMDNCVGGPESPLNIKPGMSIVEQSLVALLLHFHIVLLAEPRFLQPLTALATRPETMQESFLPTMPYEDLQQLLDTVREVDENAKLYACSKKHPYVIADCGRPWVTAFCPMCGETIGGLLHSLAEGGSELTLEDFKPQRGHTLGEASERSDEEYPVRGLPRAACGITRFLTHASLLLGSIQNDEAILKITEGAENPRDLQTFYWQHLLKDLQALHHALGKSVDEVVVFLHSLLVDAWGKRQEEEDLISEEQASLATPSERDEWETNISQRFIAPALEKTDHRLQEMNDILAKDEKTGSSNLYRLLREISNPQGSLTLDEFHLEPIVWRHREQRTLTGFLRQFEYQKQTNVTDKSLRVLEMFHKEMHILQVLRHLPTLLRFQRQLICAFHQRLDFKDAHQTSIHDLCRQSEGFVIDEEPLQIFCEVWKLIKESLATYGCMTPDCGRVQLPEKYRNVTLTPESPSVFFLPATRGPCLVAYIMMEFLLRQHNVFMESYCTSTGQKYKDLPEVALNALSPHHLVAFDPDHDLLSLVLANSEYSFEVGKDTRIDYNFAGFQRDLIEQFIQSKARVGTQGIFIPVETVAFIGDNTSATIFGSLRRHLKQEPLSQAVRHQITTQLPDLPEICQSLSNLDITINFLKTLVGGHEKLLHKFMKDDLRLPTTIASQMAQQTCWFRHTQSLWLLLSLERAKLLTTHNQDAFANVRDNLRIELSEEQSKQVKQFCFQPMMSVPKLEFLLQQIFDCFVLIIDRPPDEEGMDISAMGLQDLLMYDLEDPQYDIVDKVEELPLTADDLIPFPKDIQTCHAVQTWIHIFHNIEEKRQQLQ